MKSILLVLSATCALTACATTPPMSDDAKLALYRAHASDEVSSIPFSSTIDNWTPLGDRALAVWTSPGRAWLLDLKSDCPDLDNNYAIGFDSRDGRISAGFDSVLVLTSPRSSIPCRIDSIHQIDVEALRAAERAQDSGT